MVHVPPDEPRSGGVSRPHGYDPLPVLESLRIPMVWILGGADRGVPTPRSIANLERIQETQPVQFDIWLATH